jgi:nucleotide-binding universal stress UspA family protein
MLERIMVALDGSEDAAHALDVAADMAQRYGAELVLFHAFAHYALRPDIELLVEDSVRDVFRKAGREAAQEILDQAQARVAPRDLAALRCVAVEGEPASAIVAAAGQQQVGLIVMGTRGLSGLQELVLGSVAHKVTVLAACPVMIVK